MKHKLLTVAAAVIGIGLGGVYAFEHWPRASQLEVLGKPSLMPPITAVGKDAPAPAIPRAAAKEAASAPATAPTLRPGETRTAMLDRLANGTPSEQLLAVRELRTCQIARRMDANVLTSPKLPGVDYEKSRAAQGIPPTPQACAGIAAGQETSAMPLLAKAAKGGAPGAFFEVYQARDDVPRAEFDALFAQSIEEQAAKGDSWATLIRNARREYLSANGGKQQ
ncbi:MAG TPA: hypothetical protein VLD35_19800 [Caldimonas sp.]|nr:hypothetical protein [Caldimonas sp.]